MISWTTCVFNQSFVQSMYLRTGSNQHVQVMNCTPNIKHSDILVNATWRKQPHERAGKLERRSQIVQGMNYGTEVTQVLPPCRSLPWQSTRRFPLCSRQNLIRDNLSNVYVSFFLSGIFPFPRLVRVVRVVKQWFRSRSVGKLYIIRATYGYIHVNDPYELYGSWNNGLRVVQLVNCISLERLSGYIKVLPAIRCQKHKSKRVHART